MKLKGFRFPRKVMFIVAGVMILTGSSGAFALYMSRDMQEKETARALISGPGCTLVRTLKINRNNQRWIRRYVRTEPVPGHERVLTALRVAGILAKQEKADLYQVVVIDAAGPDKRADIRGAAIGAEVLFAPDPSKIPGFDGPFKAEYNEGAANMAGLFYGQKIVLANEDIRAAMLAMVDHEDCTDPVAEAAAAAAAATESAGHAKPAKHGDETSVEAGEGDAGHGEAAKEGEAGKGDAGEGHDAPAGEEAASGHGAPEGEHGASEGAAAGEGGMFTSLKTMVFGAPETEGHGSAETPGMIDKAKALIFGAPKTGDAGHDAASAGETAKHGSEPAQESSLIDQAKALIFGAPEPVATQHETGPDAVKHEAATPAQEPENAAHGDATAHEAAATQEAVPVHGVTSEPEIPAAQNTTATDDHAVTPAGATTHDAVAPEHDAMAVPSEPASHGDAPAHEEAAAGEH